MRNEMMTMRPIQAVFVWTAILLDSRCQGSNDIIVGSLPRVGKESSVREESAHQETSSQNATRFSGAVVDGDLRINCGSWQSYTDVNGNTWVRDEYFDGGLPWMGAFFRSIEGTDKDTLYRTYRYKLFGDLIYEIPFSDDGDVTRAVNVDLHWAEITPILGESRKFDVYIQEILVVSDLDIVSQAGGRHVAFVQTIPNIAVTDDLLRIRLASGRGNPVISAIAITASGNIPSTSSPQVGSGETPTTPTTAGPTSSPDVESRSPIQNSPMSIAPSRSPIIAPAAAPPTRSPTTVEPTLAAPISDAPMSVAPSKSPAAATETFRDIRLNAGGVEYLDTKGSLWESDTEFTTGGKTLTKVVDIQGTQESFLYQSERYGVFSYAVPIEVGTYEIVFYFSETYASREGQRAFSIVVEGETVFSDIDLIAMGVGQKNVALTLETVTVVGDGELNVDFVESIPALNNPKLNGLHVKLVKPHLAHAVADGPYLAVDTAEVGSAVVPVDGSPSHTHGIGLNLVSWVWKVGSIEVGTGESASLNLDVGEHILTLFVEDDGGNTDAHSTTVTVFPFGYPSIASISPDSDDIEGGMLVKILGSGFTTSSPSSNTIVHFGDMEATAVTVIDDLTIEAIAPPSPLGVKVNLSVQTSVGVSNAVTFTYVAGSRIEFDEGNLFQIENPTVLTFGGDNCLYVGTSNGKLAKLRLSSDFISVVAGTVISSALDSSRAILGIAVDPMDTSENPAIYIAHSKTFHEDPNNSSGESINGKVSRVRGANLDIVEDIITGLPVSDHDHGVNGLEFGDNGELYIQIGGNTNAGVPGALSGTRQQKDSVLSAATLVAELSDPSFSGVLTYDAPDDGNLNPGTGVKVFASGQRNPYDITLHSNGKLYGTDNGSNLRYGDRAVGCEVGEELPEIEEEDKINLIVRNGYYGHANRKRGADDPRQCVWRLASEQSDEDYTAPLLITPASTNGIIEWQTDHFDGQLRGNLIFSKYKDGLYRVILSDDGENVIQQSQTAIPLVGDNTLSVTQAPDGTLIDVRYLTSTLRYYKPKSEQSATIAVIGVFPRRGGEAGGSRLSIYGVNLNSGTPFVSVGGSGCLTELIESSKIVCILPGGSGTVDVVVSNDAGEATFASGYRFISGLPL